VTAPSTAFLVVRNSLSTDSWDGAPPSLFDNFHYQPREEAEGGPVRVPEVLLFDRETANCVRRERDLAARGLLNPFWLGIPDELSSLSESEFRERTRELGLIPPIPYGTSFGDVTDWWLWWDAKSADWTTEQRAAVWDLLDKVRLYEVVEIELE